MGKIELDHTGSGSGVTLSSDGTDLLLDGTAIGGGGAALELYAENPSSPTAPSAVGNNSVAIGSGSVSGSAASDDNAVAISTSATVSGSDGIAIGRLTSAAQYGTAIGRLSVASAYGSTALGANTDATANEAVAIGWTAQSTGVAAVALGNSYASGTDSFAAAIANNTSSYGATGANSVAIGSLAKASNSDALALGDRANSSATASSAIGRQASATGNSSVSIGTSSAASTSNSVAISTSAIASGNGSISVGGYSTAGGDRGVSIGVGASSSIVGKFAYSNGGIAFGGYFPMHQTTSDATPTALTTDGSAAGTTDQVILPNNSAYAFHGTIVARQQASAGTASAAWKVEGLIRREGSAGTTVLVNSATTVLDNTPGWGLALSADTTNGGLAITVTGAASTNIRWVATIHTSEVTYA